MKERIRSLDGLRGMALVLVLLHHFGSVPGFWAGVDIFFVLSGFLITTILRDERTQPRFWQIYYTRRVARIMPPFFLLLLLTALLVPGLPRGVWPSVLFFGANVAALHWGDAIGPLSVLWSLAVEEHFYFFWPAVVRRFDDPQCCALPR